MTAWAAGALAMCFGEASSPSFAGCDTSKLHGPWGEEWADATVRPAIRSMMALESMNGMFILVLAFIVPWSAQLVTGDSNREALLVHSAVICSRIPALAERLRTSER